MDFPKKPQPVIPDLNEIESKRTKNGGWTKETLEAWGVSWPPQKGWKKELLKKRETASA